MAINPLVDRDELFDDFAGRLTQLRTDGFRPLSISMYGDPFDPRFAAVWDKRPGPFWEWNLGFTTQDFLNEVARNEERDFFPVLVTATGGGPNARISCIYEQRGPGQATEVEVDQDPSMFATEVTTRGDAGWILLSATIYDDAQHQPLIASTWGANGSNVAWRATANLTEAEVQKHLEAQELSWARLAFVTASSQERFLLMFRDDHLGPIGTGTVARADLSLDAYESETQTQLKLDNHTVSLQGYGMRPGSLRRFAAIWVGNEKPVSRMEQRRGDPATGTIDKAVLDLMKASNIRGASLAVVKGSQLLLARGYTWAEPDYPTVKPTTLFRLGSVSKLVAALGLYQAVAEGLVQLTDQVIDVLPLSPPPDMVALNGKYMSGTIADLIEATTSPSPRYEGENALVKAAFKSHFPVTHEEIARFGITRGLVVDKRLDDFGYFLIGQILKKLRGVDPNGSVMKAIAPRLTDPLQIKRIRSARSLRKQQPTDEARYHSRDLELHASVMHDDARLVPREYGDENLETMETSGGLSAAAIDIARLLAAMNSRPYTPLGRPVVDQLLKNAEAKDGHGFDRVSPIDTTKGLYLGEKGGLLQSSQAGVWYSGDGVSTVMLWNGLHTGRRLIVRDATLESQWFAKFTTVVDAAATLPSTDHFPTYKMDSFSKVQNDWRWCDHCQGLFFARQGLGRCPAGGPHAKSGIGNYSLMVNAKLPYGQPNWRRCEKCEGLYFGGTGSGKCPAGGHHDSSSILADYRLVIDSPYNEHQRNWRRCAKCAGLFFQGQKASVCPTSGTHNAGSSGNYAIAWVQG